MQSDFIIQTRTFLTNDENEIICDDAILFCAAKAVVSTPERTAELIRWELEIYGEPE